MDLLFKDLAQEQIQYQPCYHPGKSCSDPRSKCLCRSNDGAISKLCYDACGCAMDCLYRRSHPCWRGCAPGRRQAKCKCLELKYVCDICDVFADFGQKKVTKCGPSTVSGMGTFIMENVKEGEFIGEYTGELISIAEAGVREQSGYRTYGFSLNQHLVVDANHFGNKMRFVNHSVKNQNVEPLVVTVRGQQQIGYFAKRNLKAGEELFTRYYTPETTDQDSESDTYNGMRDHVKGFIDKEITEKVPRTPRLVHADAPPPKERFVPWSNRRIRSIIYPEDEMDEASLQEIVDAVADCVAVSNVQ
ncbi:histone-lysine N-methyltransferase EZH1-like [Paramacrobiotus metropolitanus]|uniref:histone-lysine N-methyltransferase EZH1-like n=1 Tax=Paramacrobiotus metropolitanus TaxID=2943436 RepID=UPI002445DAD4|nr:histone-lysine N-methyltransferase EZH1-like [Paramacrobiotus metropolitanus]